jgi:hypothetical protein
LYICIANVCSEKPIFKGRDGLSMLSLVGQLAIEHQERGGGGRIGERKKKETHDPFPETSFALLERPGKARIAADRESEQ